MLRLNKTKSRKTTLHADRARWQAMSFAEKQEVIWHLQQQRQALCEQGCRDDQNKNALHSKNSESAK